MCIVREFEERALAKSIIKQSSSELVNSSPLGTAMQINLQSNCQDNRSVYSSDTDEPFKEDFIYLFLNKVGDPL